MWFTFGWGGCGPRRPRLKARFSSLKANVAGPPPAGSGGRLYATIFRWFGGGGLRSQFGGPTPVGPTATKFIDRPRPVGVPIRVFDPQIPWWHGTYDPLGGLAQWPWFRWPTTGPVIVSANPTATAGPIATTGPVPVTTTALPRRNTTATSIASDLREHWFLFLGIIAIVLIWHFSRKKGR
jgi:hypothetical protein